MLRSIPGAPIATLAVTGLASIASGHATLLAPNGGEQLTAGETTAITWQVDIPHDTRYWHLWYSATGPEGPWTVIAENIPSSDATANSLHSVDWRIPEVQSEQVRIRLRMDNVGDDYEDISDDDVIIRGVALGADDGGVDTPPINDGPAVERPPGNDAVASPCGLTPVPMVLLLTLLLGLTGWRIPRTA